MTRARRPIMSKSSTPTSPWNPSQAKVAAILEELRPLIDRFARRAQRGGGHV
jgi:hypothetical protein